MLQTVIGIDVSKETLDVVLLQGQRSWHRVFENGSQGYEHLKSWLVQQQAGPVHACLEATGQYGEGVAECLVGSGCAVSVVNPARIKRYGESKLHRNKTDKADAGLIAEFCAKETPPLWSPPAAFQKHLQALVRHLSDLEGIYQQERNRSLSGIRDEFVLAELQAHLTYLKEHTQTTRQCIQQHIQDTPCLKLQQELLLSIPGIGKITAARLLAELGDIASFENAPQLAAFAGLNPKGNRSGSSVHKKTRISKEGRAFLRYILYMPAIVARRHNPIIRAFCDRLQARGLPKMAIVAAAMRKLLHLVFGVLKHVTPFKPDFLSNSAIAT